MFLEASHRVLKVVYFHNKQNRRVDFLITTLLKLSRDKAFERFKKLEVGKTTHRICTINKRRKIAEEIIHSNSYNTLTISANQWRIESQTQAGKFYTVIKEDTECDCKLICRM